MNQPPKITVNDHEEWQKSICSAPDFDEIDQAAGDPLVDHTPRHQPKHKVRGVLSILDDLDKQSNRRFTP